MRGVDAGTTDKWSAEALCNSRTRGDAGHDPALERSWGDGAAGSEWRELATDAVLVSKPDPDVRRL